MSACVYPYVHIHIYDVYAWMKASVGYPARSRLSSWLLVAGHVLPDLAGCCVLIARHTHVQRKARAHCGDVCMFFPKLVDSLCSVDMQGSKAANMQ